MHDDRHQATHRPIHPTIHLQDRVVEQLPPFHTSALTFGFPSSPETQHPPPARLPQPLRPPLQGYRRPGPTCPITPLLALPGTPPPNQLTGLRRIFPPTSNPLGGNSSLADSDPPGPTQAGLAPSLVLALNPCILPHPPPRADPCSPPPRPPTSSRRPAQAPTSPPQPSRN